MQRSQKFPHVEEASLPHIAAVDVELDELGQVQERTHVSNCMYMHGVLGTNLVAAVDVQIN